MGTLTHYEVTLEKWFGVKSATALSAELVAILVVALLLMLILKRWRDGRDLERARIGTFHADDPLTAAAGQSPVARRRRRGSHPTQAAPRRPPLWNEPWAPSVQPGTWIPPFEAGRPTRLGPSGVDEGQTVIGPVDRLAPLAGDHDDVLEPHAETPREVHARLDREGVARNKGGPVP